MKVVVGLGNPGSRYSGTRHNVGFDVVDLLAQGAGRGKCQRRFDALVTALTEGPEQVLLVKPETFMNQSGHSVRQAMDYYQVPLDNLLVVCDDMNLPLGKLRIRARGSHGGHNGLRDIENHLGTSDYARLRLGVDAPESGQAVDHVLGRFRPGERSVISEAEATAAQAVALWIREGIDVCMNRYNG
jgi:PTH1 family peptidyl-tRNA hydrolase